jgi:RimJ/RimL family protein N-acetyltransferase
MRILHDARICHHLYAGRQCFGRISRGNVEGTIGPKPGQKGTSVARATKLDDILFRKLMPGDGVAFRAHLLSLDAVSRRQRFGMAATDAFLIGYAERCITLNAIIHGAFRGDELIGVAELRPIAYMPNGEAEIAFSVDQRWRNIGIGTTLFGRVLRSARNRGFYRLYMTCISQNAPMQALARKFSAEIVVDLDEAIGVVEAQGATIISLLMEAFDDASNLAMMAFLSAKLPKWRARRLRS